MHYTKFTITLLVTISGFFFGCESDDVSSSSNENLSMAGTTASHIGGVSTDNHGLGNSTMAGSLEVGGVRSSRSAGLADAAGSSETETAIGGTALSGGDIGALMSDDIAGASLSLGGVHDSAGFNLAGGTVAGNGDHVYHGGYLMGGTPSHAGITAETGGNGGETISLSGGTLSPPAVAGDSTYGGHETGGNRSAGTDGMTGGLGWGGDTGGSVDAAGEDDVPDDGPIGPPPCEPPLSITPGDVSALALRLKTFRPSGGSGAWFFELVQNESGGILNESTGAYLAGDITGTTDIVRLSDQNCIGEAEARIDIVVPMTVSPSAPIVPVEDGLQFSIEGGSGVWHFEPLVIRSGGEISRDGLFLAGGGEGIDIVRLIDDRSGQTIDLSLDVRANTELRVKPTTLALPIGSQTQLQVTGGSGVYDVTADGQGLDIDGVDVAARLPGTYSLSIQDRFLNLSTEMLVEAVSPLSVTLPLVPDNAVSVRLLNAGDLDGDGQDDLLLASSEGDVTAYNSGLVSVHLSGQGELEIPAQILSGSDRNDEFGRDIAVGDVNADGLTDLVVGARLFDLSVGDSGAVFVHLGQPDGTFDEAPWAVLGGLRGSDQLGWSVETCDFNGDGRMDIAGAASLYEDRDAEPRFNDQGGVYIFLQYEDGFLTEPDQVLLGLTLGEDGWEGQSGASLQFGIDMDSGDIDGDGFCDLAVGAHRLRIDSRNNSGGAYIYKGKGPDDLGFGGLTDLPVVAYAADEDGGNGAGLGRRLILGDFNSDEYLDLVVGANNWDANRDDEEGTAIRRNTNAGGVFVFAGSPLPDEPAYEMVSILDADWSHQEVISYSNGGSGIAFGDVNGDERLDLVVGSYTLNAPGEPNAGAVKVFFQTADGWPDPLAASVEWKGLYGRHRLGESVAVLSDYNGDAWAEAVAFATYDLDDGYRAGNAYLLYTDAPQGLEELAGGSDGSGGTSGSGELDGVPEDVTLGGDENQAGIQSELAPAPTELKLTRPQQSAGARFGTDVALVGDVNGDGFDDAVVTAPFVAEPTDGLRGGAGFLFPGSESGIGTVAAERLGGFLGHSGFDLVWNVTSVGDFNGDSLPDFALLLRDDEAPNNLRTEPRFKGDPSSCGPRRNASGGIYIFLGRNDGFFNVQPSFVYWLPKVSAQPDSLHGGADFNGDGFDDLVIGSFRWDGQAGNDSGAGIVVNGRAGIELEDGELEVICESYFMYEGSVAGVRVGRSATMLGDVDGDGCAEIALGADLDDLNGLNNQGSVRVIYGFDNRSAACNAGQPVSDNGCACEARMVVLESGDANSQAGISLASGFLDGDNRPDLVVGAYTRRTNNVTVGGAWVIPGTYLSSLIPKTLSDAESAGPYPFQANDGTWVVPGFTTNGQFGRFVAATQGYLGVGAPLDTFGQTVLAGGAYIYTVGPQGIDPEPVLAVAGETERSFSRLGEVLRGGTVNGVPAFIIGAFQGNGLPLDSGSAYIIPVR